MLGLVIETSCDETSVAVIKNGRTILSNIVSTQIDIHKEYGGVVPEIASREHTKNISYIVRQAVEEAKIQFKELSYIGVTYGPGLIGALLVGVSYAKALAYSLNIPIVKVNHIEGHIAANYLTYSELKPPFLSLVVSGGHSHLIYVKDYNDFEILGKTRDDAAGEAFDKVARVLGLEYPGGPLVSKLAKEGKPTYKLPKTKFEEGYDFSFSGVKTSVINIAHKEGENLNKADMAASFEENITDVLVSNTLKLMKDKNIDTVVLAGGVSANTVLRDKLKNSCNQLGYNCYIPDLRYCTDNAAMIASSAYYKYSLAKDKSIFDISNNLELNAIAHLKVGSDCI